MLSMEELLLWLHMHNASVYWPQTRKWEVARDRVRHRLTTDNDEKMFTTTYEKAGKGIVS